MFKTAWQAICNSKSIVLASHINPDCDTIGSISALYDVLKSINKKVHLFNAAEQIDKKLRFLPHFEKISSKLPLDFDTLVICDCSAKERTRIDFDALRQKPLIVNIDHHVTNSNFGDINVIDGKSPSASMVVYEMLKANNVAISPKAATAIYAGNADDTGFFSHRNVNAKIFRNSAELIELGADPIYIAKQLKQNVPLSRFRLTEHVMRSVTLLKNGRVGVSVISQEDLKRAGATIDDTKDIISVVRDLANVELAIMLREETNGEFKISLKSKNNLDVSKIALKFGGGGHIGAAGFESKEKNVDDIILQILKEFDKGMENL